MNGWSAFNNKEDIMRRLMIFALAGLAFGCGGSSNNSNMNTNAANMRGQNTNTGYVQNTNTSVPPAMPANATNVSPPSLSNSNNANSAMRKPVNANTAN